MFVNSANPGASVNNQTEGRVDLYSGDVLRPEYGSGEDIAPAPDSNDGRPLTIGEVVGERGNVVSQETRVVQVSAKFVSECRGAAIDV